MNSKIISTIEIVIFSSLLSSVATSNKVHRQYDVMKVLGIIALMNLILVGCAGAAPFAYITNYDSNNISVLTLQ